MISSKLRGRCVRVIQRIKEGEKKGAECVSEGVCEKSEEVTKYDHRLQRV